MLLTLLQQLQNLNFSRFVLRHFFARLAVFRCVLPRLALATCFTTLGFDNVLFPMALFIVIRA